MPPLGEVDVIFWSLFACGSPELPVAPAPRPASVALSRRPDVVVVTLDTARADRLGAYGYAGAQTDAIDKLATEGMRFEHAYSVLPLTIPSHASMFTGLFPFHHGIRDNGATVLADDFVTMAELFAGNGYHTGASVAAFVTTR